MANYPAYPQNYPTYPMYQTYQQPMMQPPMQYQQSMMAQQPTAPQAPVQAAPQAAQTQLPIQNGGLVEVRSYEEVERWPIAPGNTVTFIKYDRTEMYTKTASYNQFEAPVIATFLITRKEENPITQNAESNQKNADIPYAMKDDVSALAGVVRGLNDTIAVVQKDISDMKGDMYGVVGQKKTTAKKEKESGEN